MNVDAPFALLLATLMGLRTAKRPIFARTRFWARIGTLGSGRLGWLERLLHVQEVTGLSAPGGSLPAEEGDHEHKYDY